MKLAEPGSKARLHQIIEGLEERNKDLEDEVAALQDVVQIWRTKYEVTFDLLMRQQRIWAGAPEIALEEEQTTPLEPRKRSWVQDVEGLSDNPPGIAGD